jgi:hypothetical protein
MNECMIKALEILRDERELHGDEIYFFSTAMHIPIKLLCPQDTMTDR